MARDDFVVEIDHGELNEIKLLEGALQILSLLRTHRPRIFNVGHQVGYFFIDRAPGELCTHMFIAVNE